MPSVPRELTLMAIFSNCLAVLGRAIAVIVHMNNGVRSSKALGKPTGQIITSNPPLKRSRQPESNNMKLFTTLISAPLALLCLAIALPANYAVAQQKTLKELIVGTWILDSVYDQTQDGVKHNPWGDGVKGQAI